MIDLDIAEDMEREFPSTRKEIPMANNLNYDPNMYAEKGQGGSVGIVKETPFTRLAGAVERLQKAHAHVSGVAGKLCGEAPPEATTTGQRVNGSGMFGGIEELADSIIVLADEIIDHAERINRRI